MSLICDGIILEFSVKIDEFFGKKLGRKKSLYFHINIYINIYI